MYTQLVHHKLMLQHSEIQCCMALKMILNILLLPHLAQVHLVQKNWKVPGKGQLSFTSSLL